MSLAAATASAPTRIAFYARVSTEEQADRDTSRNQVEYLERKFAADLAPDSPNPMQLAGLFVDDGYSGSLALEDRPDGQRLLELARAGGVDAIVIYRLDRLGRTAKVLLEAHEQLERLGVAIVSATEPFDTRTSIGRFVFQLLGSIAELERATIRERMTLGRDRVARDGRFINGAIPYGFDLDASGHLVASTRYVDALETTEADVARQIIARVAEGYSGAAVARWLNAVGVPSTTRYHRTGGEIRETRSSVWRRDRIADMVRTSKYRGARVLHHAGGDIEQAVPALVDDVTWRRANDQLSQGSQQPLNTSLYTYLLRGRLICGLCGGALQGNYQKANGRLYYGCVRAPGRNLTVDRGPCRLGYVKGDELEALVLSELDEFFADPAAALDTLREQLRTRHGDSTDRGLAVRRLHARLRETEEGKRDVLALVKRRKVTFAEAEADLDDLAQEAAVIRAEIEGLANQATLTDALEAQLVESSVMLQAIGQEWQRWRAANDRPQLQAVVQQLVVEIKAYPDGQTRRTYTLGTPQAAADLRLTGDLQTNRQLQITRGVA